ncbi:MAG: hypothetical protein ABI411_14045 [Tahibacter sp.]
MKSTFVVLIAGLLLSAAATAGDVKNGNAYIKPVETDRFVIGGTPLGKNLLLARLQELKDSEHITGVVLRNADKASGEHRHLLKVISEYLEIAAFTEDGKNLAPLVAE